ncbi:MAG: DUF354 domain-containing protein [Bacteroidetes bacterium]|nr:DUF354 domain-containing protein [Bacteroidota bacterium]
MRQKKMKVLVDVGHPGHVHYFKNVWKTLRDRGHEFLFIAREREVISQLLNSYNIRFLNRGKGGDSKLGKLLYMLYADAFILNASIKFKPDLLLSFGSPYTAHVSRLINVPHVALNDTEHTDVVHKKFTYPFTDTIITPHNYQHKLGPKQIRINCTIEYFYLHPKFYRPDISIYQLLGISPKTKYAIVRFVSWNAFHDTNQLGLTLSQKRDIVSLLKQKYKVFISSERAIEPDFEAYQIKIPPHRMHDALAYASIFVGESGTMASESAMLGTPVVYINSLPLMCYLLMEQEYGILKHFSSGDGVFDYIVQIFQNDYLKEEATQRRDKMLSGFINPTEFLGWFIENYPKSCEIMKDNPDYQYTFK